MTQTFWWNRKMPIRVCCIGYWSLLLVFFQGTTDAFGILPRVVKTNAKTCLAAVPAPNRNRRNLDLLLDHPPQTHTTTSHDKDEEPTKGIYNNINNKSSSSSSSSFGIPQKVIKSLVSLGVACSLAVVSLPTSAMAVSDSASLLVGQQYWTIMNQEGEPEAKVTANIALMDFAVGTINTMYYDHSGGNTFQPRDFFKSWRQWLETSRESLNTRQGVENGLRFLTQELKDPYSRYLTRDELERERAGSSKGSAGFLKLGVMVEAPSDQTFFRSSLGSPVLSEIPPGLKSSSSLLSASKVQRLPVAMAVKPNSAAERMGLTVGDRVVAVQGESFWDQNVDQMLEQWSNAVENDDKKPTEITIAKPVYAATSRNDRDVIVAYRPQRLRLPDIAPVAVTPNTGNDHKAQNEKTSTLQSSLVRYELLQGHQSSLFSDTPEKVGYIRLTGFSKSATKAFVDAVEHLEKQGADAYIVDLRNNYGGIIQEAMLAASSFLRDPHAVLCFTLNAGGGFAPHDVQEYVMHKRYAGYLMSKEPRSVTLNQVKRESPELFNGQGEWSPPSSYASLREQTLQRGIRRASTVAATAKAEQQQLSQITSKPKSLVLLVNEGTASSAEVFTAALRDNGRTVAVVGTKTFGKGLIQHTFPLPDGSALRLTIAEYLTPALRHVTHVGAAQFDNGRWIGGGLQPDVLCESVGIPSNIGADLCVGVGLAKLAEADYSRSLVLSSTQNPGSKTNDKLSHGKASVRHVSEESTLSGENQL